MTPLWFSGFPFWGDFWAPGPLLADSSENFSTERPVFVASPAPMSRKLGTEDFLLNVWRIPRCSFSFFSKIPIINIIKNVEQKIRQTLSKKPSVPSFRDMGAGDATKTGRSVLKFSVESARSGPGARKSPPKLET